jgi:hypothetical protein
MAGYEWITFLSDYGLVGTNATVQTAHIQVKQAGLQWPALAERCDPGWWSRPR